MSDKESADGVAMLVTGETLSDRDDGASTPPNPTLMSMVAAAASSSSQQPSPPVAASKELRMQQQDNDTSEGDEEGVLAAVVVNEDEEDDDAPVATVVAEEEVTVGPLPKKRKTAGKKKSSRICSQDGLEAASDARKMLIDTVPRLPVVVSDSHVVRSFGQLCVEASEKDPKFSNAKALYPVGFSCDRYEFSPVHGRVLKMRCTIFDGKKLKEKQPGLDYPDGPVFRVMWGPGVDHDADVVDYPYDVYAASAPISSDDKFDTVAVPLSGKANKLAEIEPEEGMRVRVRYEHDVWYTGTITAVGDEEFDWKKKRTLNEITINYDDGSVEDTYFPDPDISIYLPGAEDSANENGIIEIDELHGKRVTSVVGSSPLEAWGKALVKLGLIDEIMLQMARDAVASARVEGIEEAKEKLQGKKRQQARARQQRQVDAKGDNDYAQPKDESPKPKEAPKAEESTMADGATKSPERLTMTEESSKSQEVPKADDAADHVQKESADDSKEGETVDSKAVSPVPPSVADNDEAGKTDAPKADKEGSKVEVESKTDVRVQSEEKEQVREPPSEAEVELRAQVDALERELSALQAEDQKASIALADARISAMGPFFINPFRERGHTCPQQSSWLATVVRKEKSKMGSTGNRRKIVAATDLLERNDTFFNGDIEGLVEGLPGSEYCPSYVFKVYRAGGAAAVSQAWVHEAKLRQEQEREKRLKSASDAKVKASQLREKAMKRKRREDERDARKKLKLEAEEQKKKVRAEERMSRLNMQVDERLFKEACFQREKVILLVARSLGKELVNRRKAAELVSSQAVMNERIHNEADDDVARKLPPLSRVYDEEVLRLWDFFTSFGSSFLEWGYLPSLPTLDSLQDSIDALRDENGSKMSRAQSVDQLVNLAITLCHPLGASLTKLLFASLIALNPGLQKDFGAAFFAEVNASTNTKDEDGNSGTTVLLPVNNMTWQEIARLSFLSDSLGDLGLSRQEQAHLLRGYRSGGHPNSKEAKRLRKSEDFPVALLRQSLLQSAEYVSPDRDQSETDFKIRVPIPSRASASPTMWTFYLHNVKSLGKDAVKSMKLNIRKALALLETTDPKPANANSFKSDLGRSLALLEQVKSTGELSSTDLQACKKARRTVLRVLDRASGEVYSNDVIGQVVNKDHIAETDAAESDDMISTEGKFIRQRIGLIRTLDVSSKDYKRFVHNREEYMSEALRLKEDLNRNEAEEEEDDDEDDEDDDEEDGANEDDKAEESGKPDESGKTDATGSAKEISEGANENGKAKEGGVADAADSVKQISEDNGNESAAKLDVKNAPEPSSEVDSSDKQNDVEVSSDVVATVVQNGAGNTDHGKEADVETVDTEKVDTEKAGKSTPYDDFSGDIPNAPELIRRCLAVLRTLCQSGPAENFLYPVDPQTNPGYYEMILKPICLREVGLRLRAAASQFLREPTSESESGNDTAEMESLVAQFARNVRLISQNCACYEKASPLIISAGEELIRIFERLFFDWVLAPKSHLPPLEFLNDDRCVEHHESDEDALILLCDGCEGKYNMSRLEPPLLEVPKGDWYCPRCLSGYCWEDVDPRIGKTVNAGKSMADNTTEASGKQGIVRRCVLGRTEGETATATLLYEVEAEDGWIETWTLAEVDEALADSGKPVDPVACVEAVAESPGYGLGIDRGVINDIVPVPLNPVVSDTAAQAAISSSVYRDTLAGSSALRLISPEEMTASEWLRLLVLLITKCSSSEIMQALASKMENDAAESMAKSLEEDSGNVKQAHEVIPSVSDDEQNGTSDHAEVIAEAAHAAGSHPDNSPSRMNGDETIKSVKAKSVEKADSSAMVIDASAIEVVAEGESEPLTVASVAASPANPSNEDTSLQQAADKARRAAAIEDKEKRQKAREDSLAAFCIKNELRPTVASFEEDVVTQVIDTTLSTKKHGLDFASSRSRGKVCHFCGLSDLALGSPLVRCPSTLEWNELMPHAGRSRRTLLLAEMGATKKLATVKVRVAGELVSMKEDESVFEGTLDGAMTECLPRNERGFQHELRCRGEVGLPFMTGSLSAHECCAVAAHKTRKERIVRDHYEKESYQVEWSNGMSAGRTLSLGKDARSRSYWKLNVDSSLFVCADADMKGEASPSRKTWHRFAEPEEIASVIYSLGADPIVSDLKRAFPAASRMLKTRKWTELLLKRCSPSSSKGSLVAMSKAVPSGVTEQEDAAEDEPYEEQEDVLVESSNGKLLWNATVVGISHEKDSDKVNGYRVHYKDWSSRFDDWVHPFRVVEPVENNIEAQAEMLEEAAASRGIPPSLENMVAKQFLHADDRARGTVSLPDFLKVSKVEPSASSDVRTFGMLKAALLLLEASLPEGAVDNSDDGPWRPALASGWRSMVQNARGPQSLMRCVILLEDSVFQEWLDPRFVQLLACLPIGWKAIQEASVASVALRIFLFDKGIQYDQVG